MEIQFLETAFIYTACANERNIYGTNAEKKTTMISIKKKQQCHRKISFKTFSKYNPHV